MTELPMTELPMTGPLLPLTPEQAQAADPAVHAWVSASAGTGKTQVLSARVLRLLAGGARPEGILALTFTKAAAAEMQTRILGQLARWVRCADDVLVADLAAIGAPADDATRQRARTLFAAALEVKGGFKVQTLHSFASALLAAFPVEAGVTPGYDALDERSGAQLRRRVLEDAIEDAEAKGDKIFLEDLRALAIRHGDTRAEELSQRLLRERRRLSGFGSGAAVNAAVRRALKLPVTGSREELIRDAIDADPELLPACRAYAAALAGWNTRTAASWLDHLAPFAHGEADHRHLHLSGLFAACFTTQGSPRKPTDKLEPHQSRAIECAARLRDFVRRVDLAEAAALHLRVGRVLGERYAEAKRHAGALDFDDLIFEAAAMLQRVAASWVLYKLDQRIDHILVDEGQDTNAAQWAIVQALTDEFFSGAGTRGDEPRTQFAVGDFKQAIYGFQGTDPAEFRRAREDSRRRAEAAGQPFREVELATSFRSVPAVLTVVDKVLEQLGPEALGMDRPFERHVPHRARIAGAVTLWPPLAPPEDAAEDSPWAEHPERELARRIAGEVRGWLDAKLFLPSKERPIQPQDVLILLRSRGDIVPELVAALHAARVPVAGADRLRLTAPIAVRDCLALLRFVLQPEDDLSAAELLVSPFLGWSQDELYALAQPRGERSLWEALKRSRSERAASARQWLEGALGMADFLTPYDFLESVLSGPLAGRARLLARLGPEARDPVEELLSQALTYERAAAPSLQGFLDWLASAEDIDIKRDPDAPLAAVRIMTVHGAKGLQAPVVILADAARTHGERSGAERVEAGDPPLPIYGATKTALPELMRPALGAVEEAERQENARLLYVALTRAEDHLFIGGLAPGRAPPGATWHELVKAALEDLPSEEVDAPAWNGRALRYASGSEAGTAKGEAPEAEGTRVAVPDWARTPAPTEERPPRPLIPSAPEDEAHLPPPGPALEAAALRGRLMHALFQKLPAVPPDARAKLAATWLAQRAGPLDADRMADEVMAVMEAPEHAALFGPRALAEAPISAVVDGRVIAGTLDVLLVEESRVRVVDFKTDRRVPEEAAAIPRRHRRQIRAYAAALGAIFPGREVEASLLYTAGPRVFTL